MFKGKSTEEVKKLLLAPKKIALVAHKNPDGDTIGATLAMYHFLKKRGHIVEMVVPNHFPDFYQWMPGIKSMLVYDSVAKQVKKILTEADIIFCLDFNNFDRVGTMSEALKKSRAIKILIDHHLEPSGEFDHYFSIINTSSTGELVYEFINEIDEIEIIDRNVAVCLYTCIMTDTGSFSYSCNNRRTYEITADLIGRGVDAGKIHKFVYDTFSEHRLRLLGFSLSERMLVWDEWNTAVIYLTKSDLQQFRYHVGDTEGLVNFPLSIKHINLAILITEKEDALRLSFRSKGAFSVNQLARANFDGGGHKNAAGGNSKLNLQETLDKLKEVLAQYKKDLDYQLTF